MICRATWLGRPIIWLSFNNEKFNAAFRYALVRMRDASEAVAFYRGEVAERTGLRRLFAPVVDNYKKYVNRMVGFYEENMRSPHLDIGVGTGYLLDRCQPPTSAHYSIRGAGTDGARARFAARSRR